MYASDLLARISRDLDTIPDYIARIERARQEKKEGSAGVLSHLGDYNYATYTEIRSQNFVEPDFSIDPKRVKECELALARYLDRHAPGNRELKIYVTAISLYLAFLARRPLHPPGTSSGEIHIIKRGDEYHCTGKRKYRDDPGALCRFCICR